MMHARLGAGGGRVQRARADAAAPELRSESSSAPKTLGWRSYLRAPFTSALSAGEGIGTCGVRAVSVAAPSAAGTGELELKAFQPLRLLPRLTKASARLPARVMPRARMYVW
jgi:hypothetical protein